ncbi:MAG: hypothetical protein U1A78_26645 [Polyangia bacterium]
MASAEEVGKNILGALHMAGTVVLGVFAGNAGAAVAKTVEEAEGGAGVLPEWARVQTEGPEARAAREAEELRQRQRAEAEQDRQRERARSLDEQDRALQRSRQVEDLAGRYELERFKLEAATDLELARRRQQVELEIEQLEAERVRRRGLTTIERERLRQQGLLYGSVGRPEQQSARLLPGEENLPEEIRRSLATLRSVEPVGDGSRNLPPALQADLARLRLERTRGI